MKIQANGISINYEVHGIKGNWLTLIHGSGENLEIWKKQVAFFSRYFRILTYDMRGHGYSDSPDCELSARLITDDLYYLLKGLNIEKTILLGHSMGGEVVLRFNQSHPDMTGGLIISNSILGAIRTISDIQNNMTNSDNESNQPVMQDINERIARFFSPGILNSKPEVIKEFKEMALRNKSLRNKPGRSPQNGMIGLLMKTPINNLNKITCPTLIIYGKYDFLVKPNMPKSVSNTIPNLHVKTLPTGHYPFLEMPDEYNEIILNFIKESELIDDEIIPINIRDEQVGSA